MPRPAVFRDKKKYDRNTAKEEERKEQSTQKLKGTVLIGHDAEIRTLLLTWQLQINLIVAGDVLHLLCLHDLQLTAKANDHTGADGFTGLHEDRKRSKGWRWWFILTGIRVRARFSDCEHFLLQ